MNSTKKKRIITAEFDVKSFFETSKSWTLERVEALTTEQVKNLKINAEKRNNSDVELLCYQVLSGRKDEEELLQDDE
jgi:hypothetical protein